MLIFCTMYRLPSYLLTHYVESKPHASNCANQSTFKPSFLLLLQHGFSPLACVPQRSSIAFPKMVARKQTAHSPGCASTWSSSGRRFEACRRACMSQYNDLVDKVMRPAKLGHVRSRSVTLLVTKGPALFDNPMINAAAIAHPTTTCTSPCTRMSSISQHAYGCHEYGSKDFGHATSNIVY